MLFGYRAGEAIATSGRHDNAISGLDRPRGMINKRTNNCVICMPTSEVIALLGHSDFKLVAEVFHAEGAAKCIVMLMHGGGQTRHSWTAAAQALSREGYTAITYDARGHGDSAWSPDGDYSFEVLALDLLAVRRQLAATGPVVGVGASMGGLSLIAANDIAPDETWDGLIFVDVTPRLETDGLLRIFGFMTAHPDGFDTLDQVAEAVAAYNPGRSRSGRSEGLRKIVKQGEDGKWRWHWDPQFIAARAALARSGAAWAEFLDKLEKDMIEKARRIRSPALLVRGYSSDVVSDDSVAHFMQHVPHARLEIVTNAGHMVAGDSNDAFVQATLRFLSELQVGA